MAGSNTLPDQIPPQSTPWSYVDENGDQIVEIHWYLFLYGLWIQVGSLIAGGVVLTPSSNIAMIDSDVADSDSLLGPRMALNAQMLGVDADTDSLQLGRQTVNAQLLATDPDAGPSPRDLANAFVLASDGLLPDPVPRAQPAVAVTVGASPFVYVPPANGYVIVNGGTVAGISFSRDGVTFFNCGQLAGAFPVARGDSFRVTYSVAPTVFEFFPF